MSWQRQTQVRVGFVSLVFRPANTFMVRLTQSSSKRHPWNFRVFCARTKGAWVQFATRVISTTQIPFFCAGKGGDTLSPLGLEDLQTDNSVQTSPKNITSVEPPQGWDQGFEKAPSAAFLLLFTLNKACLTMLKTSFFGLNLLCRKSMQMLNVASLSEATLIQLCFLCLALGADHPLHDAETSLPIQHPS